MSRIRVLLCVMMMLSATQTVLAARYIRMQIKQDDKVILESSTGDNGQSDADEVWLYLKKVRFAPANGFKPDSKAKEITLEKAELYVAYGGMTKAGKLRLVRKPAPKVKPGSTRAKEVWAVADEDIRLHFNMRFIKRSDVGRIKDPKRRLSKGSLSTQK